MDTRALAHELADFAGSTRTAISAARPFSPAPHAAPGSRPARPLVSFMPPLPRVRGSSLYLNVRKRLERQRRLPGPPQVLQDRAWDTGFRLPGEAATDVGSEHMRLSFAARMPMLGTLLPLRLAAACVLDVSEAFERLNMWRKRSKQDRTLLDRT